MSYSLYLEGLPYTYRNDIESKNPIASFDEIFEEVKVTWYYRDSSFSMYMSGRDDITSQYFYLCHLQFERANELIARMDDEAAKKLEIQYEQAMAEFKDMIDGYLFEKEEKKEDAVPVA